MMGRLNTQEALFYEFSLEEHVPEDHLLRQIDRFVDLAPLRAELALLYSHTGRPSIDPELMTRSSGTIGYEPASLAADKSYGTGPFLSWLDQREITPFIPVLDRKKQTDGKLTRDFFDYDADRDAYICPQGHDLTLKSINRQTRVKRYKAKLGHCRECPIRDLCTDAPTRSLVRYLDAARNNDRIRTIDYSKFASARNRFENLKDSELYILGCMSRDFRWSDFGNGLFRDGQLFKLYSPLKPT